MIAFVKRCFHYVESLLMRVPLAYKITSWYSIFLVLMIGLLAVFVIQFTHVWDQNEMRTELQENVIEAASHPKKYKPFDDGVFLVVYSHDGIVLRGSLPDGFPKSAPPSFDAITEIQAEQSSFLYYDAPIQYRTGMQGYIRGIVPMNVLDR